MKKLLYSFLFIFSYVLGELPKRKRYKNKEFEQYLHGQINLGTVASRNHNQVADQMSVSGSNGNMMQTPRDEIYKEPFKKKFNQLSACKTPKHIKNSHTPQ